MSAPRKTKKPQNLKSKFCIKIGGRSIGYGERASLKLPVANLFTDAPVDLPIRVITGKKPGPVLFVSSAIHGDEIIGVEVIRRLLQSPRLDKLIKGTLVLIPIVNLFGFILNSRYLPDRRDLNRSFPGSPGGSLASRIANIVMTEIVSQATHAIDIHAGSFYRENLPQIRANTDDAETASMANAFGACVVINSDIRDGSLREAADQKGVKILVYEAGEALRFDETSAHIGVHGILGVMENLGMIRAEKRPKHAKPIICNHTVWVRAPRAGILWDRASLGMAVKPGQILAYISDPFGDDPIPILSPEGGVLIGRSNLPTANEGDGLFHIASFSKKHAPGKIPDAALHEHQGHLMVHPDH